MITTLVTVYLGAWVLTTVGTFFAGRLLADRDRPADKPLLVSLVAGAVWPLVLLGAVELSSVAVYAAATSMRSDAEIYRWLADDAASDVTVSQS